MGKNNNVIQWREEMYNLATEEFGEVGAYFYTNIAFSVAPGWVRGGTGNSDNLDLRSGISFNVPCQRRGSTLRRFQRQTGRTR